MDIDNMNSMVIDILKELGNIGAGNAATALASMISKKVDMHVPNVRVLEFKNVAEILGGEENIIVGIYFELSEDIQGNIMFALDMQSAINLTNLLYGRKKTVDEMDESDISALNEIGNILASSYSNSLSQLTGLKMYISIPSLTIDMAGAILSVPAIQYGYIADHALMIETVFEGEDEKVIRGNLFFIPDLDSFEKIFKALGVS
ncbi:MAG: chemotaxis protein CheC [Tissierellia bacterium]|nr:chemotaxis protein CheC [Tissierellia bacterium]